MTKPDRLVRIHELEAEVRARGAAVHVDDGFDDALLEAFLEDVLEFEDAPMTTLRERLIEGGHTKPPDLWTLIRRLAEMNVFIYHTNHLSDAELHDWLTRFLDEEVPDVTSMNVHIDVIGSGSDEDIALSLRHYATEEERDEWRGQFPGEEIPPRQPAPFDRDRFLPNSYEQEVS